MGRHERSPPKSWRPLLQCATCSFSCSRLRKAPGVAGIATGPSIIPGPSPGSGHLRPRERWTPGVPLRKDRRGPWILGGVSDRPRPGRPARCQGLCLAGSALESVGFSAGGFRDGSMGVSLIAVLLDLFWSWPADQRPERWIGLLILFSAPPEVKIDAGLCYEATENIRGLMRQRSGPAFRAHGAPDRPARVRLGTRR